MNETRESLKDYGKHEFYFKDICQLRDKNMLQDMLTGICLFQKEIVEKKLPEYDIELMTEESCNPNILKNYIVLGELLRSYKEGFPGTNGMPPDSKSFVLECFCVESGDEEKINLISKRIEDYLKLNLIETLRMHTIDPLDVILKRGVRDLFLDIFKYRQQCADFVNQLMGDEGILLKFHGKSFVSDELQKSIATFSSTNCFGFPKEKNKNFIRVKFLPSFLSNLISWFQMEREGVLLGNQ